ncbi:c-type cytochrome [Asticcacaulis excentricus]|uniref:Cytochrome C553 n=1 Tax=Asticcacaulis excentricus TaxID=78587 RepID=A0A3G9G9U4_9CAUL|nr:cytochrome c family protein [Asticcacaulis excentricus]BBF82073.1 cytochrome C553 [Asticcacaulis excentricus]
MRAALFLAPLTLALSLSGCGDKPAETASETAAPQANAPAVEGPSEAEKAAKLATLPAPYNTADLKAGEKAWIKCRSCHTLVEGGANMVGPNLYGVFGRKSGSKADYQYSDAMKGHNAVWDFATLDDYIAHPQTTVPGTKMGFMGLKDETERHNLIAYLKVETTPAQK